MQDAVSQVLAGRDRSADGFGTMLVSATALHAALVVLMVLFPHAWGAPPDTQERDVMVISLGGAPGPRSGGMTPMGGRPVQEVAPAPARPEPVRPPAAKAPEMIEPLAKATPPKPAPPKPAVPKPAPTPAAPRESLASVASKAPPVRGEQLQQGSAVAQTGGAGIGLGLSTGGGGTGGEINVGDFCCPDTSRHCWNSSSGAGIRSIRSRARPRSGLRLHGRARCLMSRWRRRAASRCSTSRRSGRS